ncbi:Hypothetical predicted protein [Paramuricea clavata]|uniref:Uncharacterized protein n=1 Tax=Paramuricea clavata TaxID=317549 RepID=A0A7D9I3X3_PARCT|nr:Hypothetical predicted protein [Paramuricea clavata]
MIKEWKNNLEKETDDDRRQITQRAVNVAEQAIDDARLEMGQVRRSEEGTHRYREIVRDNIRTKFERFHVWAKEYMGALAAIAISIAGIITTVVWPERRPSREQLMDLELPEKRWQSLQIKPALPILVPILNMLSTILSWGAKGLAFLAQNLWIVAIVIAGLYSGPMVIQEKRDDMVEDGIASEATRKKISKDDAVNDDVDAAALFEVFGTKQRIRIGKILKDHGLYAPHNMCDQTLTNFFKDKKFALVIDVRTVNDVSTFGNGLKFKTLSLEYWWKSRKKLQLRTSYVTCSFFLTVLSELKTDN